MLKRTWGAMRASWLPVCSVSVMALPAAAQTTNPFTALEEVVVTAHTDAEYGDDFIVACSAFQTVTATCPAGGTTPSIDNLANVSDWRVLVGSEYARQVGPFELFLQTDLVYESGHSMSSSPDPLSGFSGGGATSYISTPTGNLYRTYGIAVDFRL